MIKKFIVRRGVFLKTKWDCQKIIQNIYISIIPLLVVNIIFKGIEHLLLLLLSIITCYLTEYIIYIIKKDKKSFKYLNNDSFTLLTPLILSLFVPLKLFYIIFSSILASTLKILFKGFGKYPISPYLITLTITLMIYGLYTPELLNEIDTYFNSPENTYLLVINGVSLLSFMFLIYKNSIKYHITAYYLLSYLVLNIIMLIVTNMSLNNSINMILNSQVILASIYLATDSVVSPITIKARKEYGIILGVVTFILSLLIKYDGAVFAIFLCHFITYSLDNYNILRKD